MVAAFPKSETTHVEDACLRLGINRSTGYAEIQRTGTLGGIPVIRAGSKRVLIPTAALDRLLAASEEVDQNATFRS